MSTGKILLMDDEIAIRISIGKLFEHNGFEVDLASDGSEAVYIYNKGYRLYRSYK